MSGSYRNIIATIAGLAVVASALFLLIRDLSAVDSAYSHSAADASVEYQSDARAYIKERCFTPTGITEMDCAAKAEEAAREGQRKEQDLAAQNITAWWTKVMGIAALIGMALSAVGVWLVKTTFDETRKANSISRESVYRQLRAYVTIDGSEHRHKDGWDWVTLTLHNSGSTPATRVKIFSTMFQVEDGMFVGIPIETEAHDIGGQSKMIQNIKWYDWTKRIEARLPRPHAISGKVVYSACIPDEFGKIISYEIDFELVPASAKVSDNRMGLPGNTYF
jgi:hypothetical protein